MRVVMDAHLFLLHVGVDLMENCRGLGSDLVVLRLNLSFPPQMDEYPVIESLLPSLRRLIILTTGSPPT